MPLASCGDDTTAILKCIVSGFFANVARLGPDGLYRTIRGGRRVQLHPNSVLAKFGAPPEFVVFDQYVSLSQDFLRGCSKIHPKWLLELAPHFYQSADAGGRSFIRRQAEASRALGGSELDELLQGQATNPSTADAAKRIFARESGSQASSLLATALQGASAPTAPGRRGTGGPHKVKKATSSTSTVFVGKRKRSRGPSYL